MSATPIRRRAVRALAVAGLSLTLLAGCTTHQRDASNYGDTEDNFKSAIAGETYEYTQMYPGFAATAREEGFAEIADWFETLARAEKSHAGRFAQGLEAL